MDKRSGCNLAVQPLLRSSSSFIRYLCCCFISCLKVCCVSLRGSPHPRWSRVCQLYLPSRQWRAWRKGARQKTSFLCLRIELKCCLMGMCVSPLLFAKLDGIPASPSAWMTAGMKLNVRCKRTDLFRGSTCYGLLLLAKFSAGWNSMNLNVSPLRPSQHSRNPTRFINHYSYLCPPVENLN